MGVDSGRFNTPVFWQLSAKTLEVIDNFSVSITEPDLVQNLYPVRVRLTVYLFEVYVDKCCLLPLFGLEHVFD
jgi:hypothetical protein